MVEPLRLEGCLIIICAVPERQEQTIVTQLGALHNAEERIRLQQISVRASQEDLRVSQQRYALGAGTFLDVLNSETSLIQAQQALIQARLDYRNARAKYVAAVLARPCSRCARRRT